MFCQDWSSCSHQRLLAHPKPLLKEQIYIQTKTFSSSKCTKSRKAERSRKRRRSDLTSSTIHRIWMSTPARCGATVWYNPSGKFNISVIPSDVWPSFISVEITWYECTVDCLLVSQSRLCPSCPYSNTYSVVVQVPAVGLNNSQTCQILSKYKTFLAVHNVRQSVTPQPAALAHCVNTDDDQQILELMKSISTFCKIYYSPALLKLHIAQRLICFLHVRPNTYAHSLSLSP